MPCSDHFDDGDDLKTFVNTCKSFHSELANGWGDFFANHYGETEGGRDRAGDAGWVCAQRRPGRALALGWLHSKYSIADTTKKGGNDIPDYLLMVDDDSYFDMSVIMEVLSEDDVGRGEGVYGGRAVAGCAFRAGEG